MRVSQTIGALIYRLSFLWFLFGFVRLLFSFGHRARDGDTLWALGDLGLAVGAYHFGRWLRDRTESRPVRAQAALVREGWWQASYGFRLTVFAGAVWLIGAFLLQDSYDRQWSTIVVPPLAALAVYFGYRMFVDGGEPKRAAFESHPEEVRAGKSSLVQRDGAATAPEKPDSHDSPRERQARMDELIKRTKGSP